jgi:hypothetical protein
MASIYANDEPMVNFYFDKIRKELGDQENFQQFVRDYLGGTFYQGVY